MIQTEILILNFEEIRRRSIKLGKGLTPEYYSWKPDISAMSCLEMVRHVLESEHLFHVIVNNRGNLGDCASPWTEKKLTNLQDELEFAKKYREDFLNEVRLFSPQDLSTEEVVRTEVGQRRKLVGYLQRIAYHESLNTGQMLVYFRILGLNRSLIWD
jgi:DinB superfamily